MGLEPVSYGKSGKPSFDKEFQKVYAEHIEVNLLTRLNKVNKLYGTYAKQFWLLLQSSPDAYDGRIRSNFRGVTRTGRASSFDPNLQQTIRKGSILSKIILGLFKAPKGRVIIKLDVMAVEVRGWGSISGDPVWRKNFSYGKELREKYFLEGPDAKLLEKIEIEADPHRINASSFYGIPIADVIKSMRDGAKGLTFGAIYGLTIKNLAKHIKKPLEETKKIYNLFFEKYVVGSKWLKDICKFAKSNLFVTSPLGRKRRLWHYLADYPLSNKSTFTKIIVNTYDRVINAIHAKGDNRAKNTPIQATASDLAFIGAFFILYHILRLKKDWKVLNVVHDSLEAEIPVQDIKEYILTAKIYYEKKVVKYIHKHFNYYIDIPTEIDFEIGFTSRDMIKWDGAYNTLEELQEKFMQEDESR
jgi:DNA polymerase I-like protein with 3'-5' exonuclease and polymerase domains